MKDLLIWEKYRPKSLKQMVLIPRIEKLIENGIQQNMIFYGHSGTGKTTLSRILAIEYNSLQLNGKLGVELLSTKIKNHFDSLNLMSKDSSKIVFIDEFDRASVSLQDGLKSFIEDFPTMRFVFTTNHVDKITDELRSRFNCVPFEPIDSTERDFVFNKQINYLRAVCKREGSELYTDVELFKNIVQKSYPDLRRGVVKLEEILITGDVGMVNSDFGSTQEDLFSFIMEGDLNPIVNYDYIMNNFFITFDDAFKYLSRPFFEYLREHQTENITRVGAAVLKKQKEYNETLSDTPDPLIHLINYVIDLKTAIK